MAERRMFTKKITDDDNFLNLSSSAQALYLHLSMSADDDGFCNNVTMAMFKAHASVSDLEALLNARYLLQFDNGVIVIKHWRMANAIRTDRYKPTAYKELLSQLEVKENGAYTLKSEDGCQVVAEWLPSGCQMVAVGKDRLEEDRLGKNNNIVQRVGRDRFQPHQLEAEFDTLWSMYPRKEGKQKAFTAYQRARRNGTEYQEVYDGIIRYQRYIEETVKSPEFIAMGQTWFNQARWQDEYKHETSHGGYESNEFFKMAMEAGLKGVAK